MKKAVNPKYVKDEKKRKDHLEGRIIILLHLVVKRSLLLTMTLTIQLIHLRYQVMNTTILLVIVRLTLKLKQKES